MGNHFLSINYYRLNVFPGILFQTEIPLYSHCRKLSFIKVSFPLMSAFILTPIFMPSYRHRHWLIQRSTIAEICQKMSMKICNCQSRRRLYVHQARDTSYAINEDICLDTVCLARRRSDRWNSLLIIRSYVALVIHVYVYRHVFWQIRDSFVD